MFTGQKYLSKGNFPFNLDNTLSEKIEGPQPG